MEELTFLSWNIRGACNSIARSNLRGLVSKQRPNIILLQETKCQKWSDLMKDSIWPALEHDWMEAPLYRSLRRALNLLGSFID